MKHATVPTCSTYTLISSGKQEVSEIVHKGLSFNRPMTLAHLVAETLISTD
jgi:hypothetical protein